MADTSDDSQQIKRRRCDPGKGLGKGEETDLVETKGDIQTLPSLVGSHVVPDCARPRAAVSPRT